MCVYRLPEWKAGQPKPADWPSHIHPPKDVDLWLRSQKGKTGAATTTSARQQLLERSSPEVRPIVEQCPADTLPTDNYILPVDGEPTAALAWTLRKIAVLTASQAEAKKAFEAKKWKVYTVADQEQADKVWKEIGSMLG